MTETSHEPVRHDLLIRTALQVLADDGGRLPRAKVLARVRERVELTPYEAAFTKDSDTTCRAFTQLSWRSTDMKVAGWITKTNAGWEITEAGREALTSHPEDGVGLSAELSQAYQDWVEANRHGGSEFKRILDAALDCIDEGTWTTYGDLARVTGTDDGAISNALWSSTADAAHRVIPRTGKPSPSFHWPDGRHQPQQEALEAEGVVFDSVGIASESQHLRTADLRDFLEDKGILNPAPRRAWLVKGSAV
ncbi:MAG: MGMT family protein, partial [Actinomyces sp.]|nr:MGMT family protein [Actinomyces sp.]